MFRGLQLPEDALWEHRKCPEYTQKIPDWTPEQHFDFEVKRHDVQRSWRASRRALFFSCSARIGRFYPDATEWVDLVLLNDLEQLIDALLHALHLTINIISVEVSRNTRCLLLNA